MGNGVTKAKPRTRADPCPKETKPPNKVQAIADAAEEYLEQLAALRGGALDPLDLWWEGSRSPPRGP